MLRTYVNIPNGVKSRHTLSVGFCVTHPRSLFRKTLADRAVSSSTRAAILLATLERKAIRSVFQSSGFSSSHRVYNRASPTCANPTGCFSPLDPGKANINVFILRQVAAMQPGCTTQTFDPSASVSQEHPHAWLQWVVLAHKKEERPHHDTIHGLDPPTLETLEKRTCIQKPPEPESYGGFSPMKTSIQSYEQSRTVNMQLASCAQTQEAKFQRQHCLSLHSPSWDSQIHQGTWSSPNYFFFGQLSR